MHEAAYRYVQKEVARLPLPAGLVLEIGSRNVNGSVRGLFADRRYIGIDVEPGPDVDVVSDGSVYIPPTPPAVVVCAEVLEHTRHAAAICHHVFELLPEGGVFLMTAAGPGRAPHSAHDGGPLQPAEYYANVTEADAMAWLADFTDVQVQLNHATHDIYATAIKRAL